MDRKRRQGSFESGQLGRVSEMASATQQIWAAIPASLFPKKLEYQWIDPSDLGGSKDLWRTRQPEGSSDAILAAILAPLLLATSHCTPQGKRVRITARRNGQQSLLDA